MVVFADKSREAELIEIWKQSFGDSEEYIRTFFEWNLSKTMVIVYEVDGKAVSVAYLLPVTYERAGQKAVPCWYLYAAATLPEFRGRGYFGEIMKVVREEVAEPIILVPGEISLVAFYQKQGLHVWLEGKNVEVILDAQNMSKWLSGRDFHVRDISGTEYAAGRNEILSKKGYIKWDKHFMEYICCENKMCGGFQKEVAVGNEKYIVLYRIEGDVLRVLEVLPQKEAERAAVETCIQVLLKETGCLRAEVCLNPTVMATDRLKLSVNQGYFNLTMG